jgi:hypothetical protein
VRDLRPPRTSGFEVRFETPPGGQVQVDFAHFEVEFADDPGATRIVLHASFGYFPWCSVTPGLSGCQSASNAQHPRLEKPRVENALLGEEDRPH